MHHNVPICGDRRNKWVSFTLNKVINEVSPLPRERSPITMSSVMIVLAHLVHKNEFFAISPWIVMHYIKKVCPSLSITFLGNLVQKFPCKASIDECLLEERGCWTDWYCSKMCRHRYRLVVETQRLSMMRFRSHSSSQSRRAHSLRSGLILQLPPMR